ncbi:hypothetical protein NCAS_0H01860 [Naumovozyma castellii]|uniref:Chromatin modification-related protein n=1 Tax=Naumovozyma castellii TaxID=27288 RepID=G0VJ18_NAUCA|nr:hypothetical protein NCAS_0H01860 [Naumovozyma castellii CBS 4309]CCC71496.1 hypothetical protein NCAS_0H01860 [Naumovozyma castellii CBS 4309]
MDPSLVLEETVQDISNLQSEFKHLYEEIQASDWKEFDDHKSYLQKDSQLQKFVKQHGSTTEAPNEKATSDEIRDGISKCKGVQQTKCELANTALFLVARHLRKLEKSISILEEDGVLAPAENEDGESSNTELSRESSVLSAVGLNSTTDKKKRTASSSSSGPTLKRKKQSRTSSLQRGQLGTDGPSENKSNNSVVNTPGRDLDLYNDELFANTNDNDEEDKTLYCFCQSVSYGEMVACDGPNCKYEWFHYGCVNLKEPPKGLWYCPDCRQEMAKKNLKKKRS